MQNVSENQTRSESQREASRKNGTLSRGPVTEAGKRRSSQNALRHGLFARSIVMANERQQNFNRMARQYRERFQPKDAVELGFVEEIIAAFWQMRRLWAMLTSKLNDGLPEAPDPDPAAPSGDAFTTEIRRSTTSFMDLADSPRFHTLLRYEGELHRKFHRILRNLQQLQQHHSAENQNPRNEPKNADSTVIDISRNLK